MINYRIHYPIINYTKNNSSWETHVCSVRSINCQPSIETEVSLPYSEKAGREPEPNETSPRTNERTNERTNGRTDGRTNERTPWSESASELCRPSDRRLSAKWLPTFADKGCHVISVTDPYGRILGFLDRSRYFSIKYLLSCTHEAEWTPFQTHYFFFLVVPGIEPGPPDL
jgi:hypothetical protein